MFQEIWKWDDDKQRLEFARKYQTTQTWPDTGDGRLAAMVEEAARWRRLYEAKCLELAKAQAERDAARAEIVQIADVWEAMWRAKHKEAQAEWLLKDILHYVNERETWLDESEAEVARLQKRLEELEGRK